MGVGHGIREVTAIENDNDRFARDGLVCLMPVLKYNVSLREPVRMSQQTLG